MVAAGARPRAGGRRRLFQAREGAAVLGLRPPVGRAGTMNRAPPTHSARSSEPGCQESPFAGAAAAAAFLGMARPSRREGKLGVVFPSFLPFFEIQIPSSGRSAGARRAPGGLSCQPPRLGGARGLREPRSRAAAARPRDGGPAWRWGDARPPRRISRPPRVSGSGPAAAGAEGVAGAAESVGRQLHGGARRPPARLPSVRPPATPRPAALPASRLTARGPAPGRHALRPRSPRGPQLATVGASPCPARPLRGPCASDGASSARARVPGGGQTHKVPAARRPPARAPASAIFCQTSNFRASRGDGKEGRGPRGAGGRRLLPARHLGARGPGRAARPIAGRRRLPWSRPASPPPPPPGSL